MDQLLIQALRDLQLADRIEAGVDLSPASAISSPEIVSTPLNDDFMSRVTREFQSNTLRERFSQDSNGITFPYSARTEPRDYRLPWTSPCDPSSLRIDDTHNSWLEIELKFTRWNAGECKTSDQAESQSEEASIRRDCSGGTLASGAIRRPLADSTRYFTPLAIDNNQPRTILNRLHARVAQTYYPDLGAFMDHSTVLATITSNGIPQTFAATIAHEILRLHEPNNSPMTGLRVSRLAPLTNEDHFWIVLEWMVGMDTDVLAIFQIDNVDDSAAAPNWLMHYGYGRGCTATSGTAWATSWISWTVTNLGSLKSLFGAARHILGILEIPARDSITLYTELEPDNRSEEESTPCLWALLIAKNVQICQVTFRTSH